jgi:hydroxymethylpyrimidine/phosphomethylpyrimidine kinase
VKPPICVLTIAGSDSGAGAGIQVDARVIHALGGYGCTAITAVTAQNTRGVRSWRPVPPPLLEAQITAVLEDFPIAAVKTGLLPGAAAVRAVAKALKHRRLPLVIDPVIGSTSGTRFLPRAGLEALETHLLPLATLVTPNWPEAELLAGEKIRNYADAEAVAKLLASIHGCAVLLKGGHAADHRRCRDCLVEANGRVQWFDVKRIVTRNTHGTGCVLSAAIAFGLGQGQGLPKAIAQARAFLLAGLRAGRGIRWRGAGSAFPR